MEKMILTKHDGICILAEEAADSGIKKIAGTLAEDLEMVLGERPRVISSVEECGEQDALIWVAVPGQSPLLESWEKGQEQTRALFGKKPDLSALCGRRECYQFAFVEHPRAAGKKALLIAGSDKRGAIYGMFRLSEESGVSPLVYWGDAAPCPCESLVLIPEGSQEAAKETETEGIKNRASRSVCLPVEGPSKEPSVEYRGFFINDEWPCFGNWAFDHFGGFCADMYRRVFELLLRLKGNYIWPAMWSSCFAQDGPGLANAELADELGVVVGSSHHEPCMRAGEEFQKSVRETAAYGTEWNFAKNREGILRFWEDGLKRSLRYESLVTVGMRGENDTPLLGLFTPLADNIELLKEIILNQKRMIEAYSGERKPRQLLALYKEVEPYFYGDENTPGLQDWDGLKDVILMLCEDNFGNMRTLPPRRLRDHQGGWGMYYHFDYHGDPVSYEWVNSASLEKTWEQMTMAYDYGVRSVWLVNVGDLKFNLYPLQYFMEMAYDFDRWGSRNRDSVAQFEEKWAKETFGNFVPEDICRRIGKVQKEYTRLNSLRRPESLNDQIYHPCHFGEGERMLARAARLEQENEALYEDLPAACKDAYFSMIYFQAAASANLLQMHLLAGQNHLYARQGNIAANRLGDEVLRRIRQDEELARRMREFGGGKWAGMELASHIGFTHWNDQDCRYPVRMQLYPMAKPRMILSRADMEEWYTHGYNCETLRIRDFADSFAERVQIRLGNSGRGTYRFTIKGDACPWLRFSCLEGEVEELFAVDISFDRTKFMAGQKERATARYMVCSDQGERIALEVEAAPILLPALTDDVYVEDAGRVVMPAVGFGEQRAGLFLGEKAEYAPIAGLGKYGGAMKVNPSTGLFLKPEEMPCLTYRFYLKEAQEYEIALITNPANPVQRTEGVRLGIRLDEGELQILSTVKEGYRADVGGLCQEWAQGVLTEEHRTTARASLEAGCHTLSVFCVDAAVALERIEIAPKEKPIPASYLGAPVSPRCADLQSYMA